VYPEVGRQHNPLATIAINSQQTNGEWGCGQALLFTLLAGLVPGLKFDDRFF
jgi:hypothetical protein